MEPIKLTEEQRLWIKSHALDAMALNWTGYCRYGDDCLSGDKPEGRLGKDYDIAFKYGDRVFMNMTDIEAYFSEGYAGGANTLLSFWTSGGTWMLPYRSDFESLRTSYEIYHRFALSRKQKELSKKYKERICKRLSKEISEYSRDYIREAEESKEEKYHGFFRDKTQPN